MGHIPDRDNDGSQVVRVKTAMKGWTYSAMAFHLTTSDLDSATLKDANGDDSTGVTLKLYNSSSIELTEEATESTATKTVIDFELPEDIELIGGRIMQPSVPASDLWFGVIGVPDVPYAYGGSREMVRGVNLKYVPSCCIFETDGRSSKYMAYSSDYHTSKLRFIFNHATGLTHDIMVVLDGYRA